MTNAQPEPSMEEILASIRRIISEDEEDQPDIDRSQLDGKTPQVAKSAATTTTASPDKAAEKPDAGDDDALTKMLDRAEHNRNAGISPNATKKPEAPASTPASKLSNEAEPTTSLQTDTENTKTVETASTTKSSDDTQDTDKADNELKTEDVKMVKSNLATVEETKDAIIDTTTAQAASAAFGNLTRSVRVADGEGQTLEAMVEEMLRPLVKDWLDANLSRIVEEKVEYEVQRLARRG